MKKIILPIVFCLLVLGNSTIVNAAHQHSENCYVVQEHVHTGNEASGGGCYGEANYHTHSGDSASGGGCYGAANYHVHSGSATSGGGCYGAANHHVHSGDATNGGGCYGNAIYHVHTGNASSGGGCYGIPKQVTTTVRRNCLYNQETRDGDYYNAYLVCGGCSRRIQYLHSYIDPVTGAITVLYSESTVGMSCMHDVSTVTTVYELNCGKTTETAESYSLSCGKSTDTIESYSMNCGKTADTVEGYSLNCGKTVETVESYSLNCDYTDNKYIRVLICTLGSNEYARSKEIKINIKNKGSYYKEDTFMVEKISTDKAPAAIGPYSQGIIAGDFFFASGQIPINPATGNIEGDDIAAQAELVMKNIGELLQAANLGYGHVVKTSCFLADMNDFAAFNEVYAKYFTGKPARSCVAVKTLPKNVLCEVEVIAYVNAEVFDV